MKVTVVFEDNKIMLDSIPKFGADFPPFDANWRVIQWRDDHGWIEVHTGERMWLSDIALVQPFISMWNAMPEPAPEEPSAPAD